MSMSIPIIRLDRVFHIGTLDPKDLGKNSGACSQEGKCLSVSLCPNSWLEIAELGGYPLHELTTSGGVFIDVMTIMKDDGMISEVLDWARGEGLVEDQILWKAWSTDEDGDWNYVLCGSAEEALSEIDFDGVYDAPEDAPGPDGGPGVERTRLPVATAALEEITGMSRTWHVDATDSAVMAWAKSQAPAILGCSVDGVWWRENHDVEVLSSPRGGIFPDRVSSWIAERIEFDGVDDIDELDSMPDTEMVEITGTPAP